MKYLDVILNRITMYRVVLYYLIALLVAAAVLGQFHLLPYSPVAIAFSTGVLLLSAVITNVVFAHVWKAVPGSASTYITALILALIVTPVMPTHLGGMVMLAAIGAWAAASKYLLAIGGKHIFNPAAFAVALSALAIGHAASWWAAGNLALLPIILIGGLATIRKIQRFDLVSAFALAAFLTVGLTSASPLHAIWTTIIHSSFLFLASVMLTEPATMPPTRSMRIAYGALVGIWFAPAMHIGSFYFTPELALLLGNVFVYVVSPKGRLMLTLKERVELAKDTYEFIFTPDRRMPFTAGQYLEWTLPEGKGMDAKGNRRYFTIASAPQEREIHLGVKLGTPLSAFKRKLMELRPGDTISAAQLAGDFTLPKDQNRKLAFIAGGIGITPFRSMIGAMLAGDTRDAMLMYSNKKAEDVAYYDFLEDARERVDLKTVFALTNDTRAFAGAHQGPIDAAFITSEIPDYRERTFYISGPRAMVVAFQKTLRDLGVSPLNIKTDYFPGFV